MALLFSFFPFFLRLPEVAVGAQRAAVAVRLAGGAAVAAEEHHAVAEITRLLRREDGAQLLFHAQRVFAAVGEAETAVMRMQCVSQT